MSQRGRPKGSLGKKKPAEAAALRQQKLSLSRTLPQDTRIDDTEDATSVQQLTDTLDTSIELIYAELQKIRKEFGKAIEKNTKEMKALRAENTELKTICNALEEKIEVLSKTQEDQAMLINKQERFSRRNNVRIVGMDYSQGEDCLKIASEVFAKTGVNECVIERAHRDGRSVPNRSSHVLVKLVNFNERLSVMKNARRALREENYNVVDDLTKVDLLEKRKWLPKVNELFRHGTRLHFAVGCCRAHGGKPYDFSSMG